MLQVSPLFTDGAVLCRRKEIRVFGYAESNDRVLVTIRSRDGTVLAEGSSVASDGRFTARLRPLEAMTDLLLTVVCGEETFCARDIAVGEVFLAGGQSNMELELRNADEGPETVRTHDDPMIRFFNVPKRSFCCEEQQRALEATRWEKTAPGSGAANSAVATFFAETLRKSLPDIPIGVIGCYWGGTSVTCWMDEETLRETAEGIRYLEDYAEKSGDKSFDAWLAEENAFQKTMEIWNGAVDRFRRDHPGAPWNEVTAACGPCPWDPPAGPGSPFRPAGLAGSMLEQAAPFALTAFLFYQGEEDAGRTDHYDTLLISMIRYWRRLFRDETLPFLNVQLPMWLDFGAENTFRWPALRLAQAGVRDTVRNSGMVCLLDQGEYGNIHPTAKRVVGERLCELAKTVVFGLPGAVSPRAVGKYTEGSMMTVILSDPVRTPEGEEPALLELAGEDGDFKPARAMTEGSLIRLTAAGVARPVHVRYAWTDFARVNLFGGSGLPLEPFRL